MVAQFPLDYMHLCCLGVMRRLLIKTWMKGPYNCRIGSTTVKLISQGLRECRSYIPVEFARKPRGLDEIERWKATEFRQFLLYTGPVVLRNKLSSDFYNHFLLYHVAMTILLAVKPETDMILYAGELLRLFVAHTQILYGNDSVIYNIHCLIHLVDDTLTYGSLNNVCAYPFEDYLGFIKQLVRKGGQPLQQVVRRISEGMFMNKVKQYDCTKELKLKQEHYAGPVPSLFKFSIQYKEVQLPFFKITISKGDNCVEVHNDIAIVQNILGDHTNVYLVLKIFGEKGNFYCYPVDSSKINVYTVSRLSDDIVVEPISSIKRKCVLLPYTGNTSVVLPMLHL